MRARIRSKRLVAASVLAISAMFFVPVPAASEEEPAGKLNYYRMPGEPPICADPCDGQGHCCTF